MASRIWVIRHGDRLDFEMGPSAWEKIAQRINDPPLSELGRLQVSEVGAFIRGVDPNISRVLTSPFLRCIETADPIAAQFLGCKISIDDSLFEVVYTTEDFPSNSDRSRCFSRIDLDYQSEPRPEPNEAFPVGAMARYGEAARVLAQKFPNETIVLCTHAAGVSAIVSCLSGIRVRDLPEIAPAAPFCLDRLASGDESSPSYTLSSGFVGGTSHYSRPPGKTLPWPRASDTSDAWGLAWIEAGDGAPWISP